MISVVLPYCHKDRLSAIRLLEWIRELDGDRALPTCFLVSSQPVKDSEDKEVIRAAFQAFQDVWIIKQRVADERGWPQSPNTLFKCACDRMKAGKESWLWLEPDATPTKPGWLKMLDDEYQSCGKPFMGFRTELPWPHLNGVAIYPPNVEQLAPFLVRPNGNAFDCTSPQECAHLLTLAHASALFQHTWSPVKERDLSKDAPAWTFDGTLEGLKPEAVIFHRCKDGSLIDCLRQNFKKKPGFIERIKSFFVGPEITVVITNFNRPDKVRHAFSSCMDANVKDIVISSSGCGDDLKAMHNQFRKEKPDVVIDAIPDDRGCNEMWLRGVRLAKSKWVHLLHDDDMLLPDFKMVVSHLNNGSSFFHWNGAKHAWPKNLLDGCNLFQTWFPDLESGVHNSKIIWPVLLADNNWSISPVSGLFTRDHLLETLEEFERDYREEMFFYKPRMQAGNDLLIWLKAVEKYPNFTFITRPLVSYGHWDGSASFSDYGNKTGLLSKIYNATRDQFLSGPHYDMLDSRRMVHIQSAFIGPDERDRVGFASRMWQAQYRLGQWSRDVIQDSELPRLFEDGKRKLPYVRDMIDLAVSRNSDGDPIFVFTNTDTIPVQSLTRQMLHAFKTNPCAYSFRRDIKDGSIRDEKSLRLDSDEYPGCDLFAFTGRWWKDNRKQLPDLLYATDTWDYCMRKLMDRTGGVRFFYLIYHTLHQGEWDRNKNSQAHKHNHEKAEGFLKNIGIDPYWISKQAPTVHSP